ncbi:MAG TPA: hypothetical protein VFZ65_13525 [Planctomycetota bacterium]|nr:hypothetical protein [Planctomycetota bacterium]
MSKFLLPTLCTTLLFAACGGDATKGATDPKAPKPAAPSAGDTHGEEQSLGALTIGTHTFAVIQEGSVVAGKEAHLDLVFAAGIPLPGTVRAWAGVESSQGSMKAKLGKENETTLHGHIEVPKPIPEGSKFWIEIEENGATKKDSVAWK